MDMWSPRELKVPEVELGTRHCGFSHPSSPRLMMEGTLPHTTPSSARSTNAGTLIILCPSQEVSACMPPQKTGFQARGTRRS